MEKNKRREVAKLEVDKIVQDGHFNTGVFSRRHWQPIEESFNLHKRVNSLLLI